MNSDSEKCIICGYNHLNKKSADFVPFLKDRMFHFNNIHTDLISCPNCKISYSSYRPNDIEMSNLYSGYRNEDYQKTRQKYEPEYTKEFNYNLGFNEESKFIRHYIMENCIKPYITINEITNILDFGGDAGQYIPLVFEKANKFVYEVSNVQPVNNVTLLTDISQLKNYKWDLIMCCHVLEHVSDPIDILNKIKSLTPLNGYIYVEVPYEDYYHNDYNNFLIHEHINFFTKETFSKIFNEPEYLILTNNFVDIPNTDGQVFSKHIQVLVKKINNTTLSQIDKSIKNELTNNREQNIYLKQQLEVIKEQNIYIKQELEVILQFTHRPTFIQQIFSIRDENSHKVLRILGIKMKFRRENANKR